MNTQQKFINNLLQRAEEDSDNKKPTKQCEIDYGMFRGGGRERRERSVDSDDFRPQKKVAAKKTKKTKTPAKKQYIRTPVPRLKSDSL